MRRLISACALAFVLACNQATVTEPEVTELADTSQLAVAFNSVDTDAAQLILLLSPT